jgi:Leucine-rich repeat (LRR) protein
MSIRLDFDYPLLIPPIPFTELRFLDFDNNLIKNFNYTGIMVDGCKQPASDLKDLDISTHKKILNCSSKSFEFSLHSSMPKMILYGGSLMDARAKHVIFCI